MDKDLFDELVQGLNEMVSMEKGELNEKVDTQKLVPHYKSNLKKDNPLNAGGGYITSIRYDLGMSQADFAKVLGVSTVTVSSWEQGVRKPNGAVAKLLTLIENDPSRINELTGMNI